MTVAKQKSSNPNILLTFAGGHFTVSESPFLRFIHLLLIYLLSVQIHRILFFNGLLFLIFLIILMLKLSQIGWQAPLQADSRVP